MTLQFNEAIYSKVKQWLLDNSQDGRLSDGTKQDLLNFNDLAEQQKENLQAELLKIYLKLPKVILRFMPPLSLIIWERCRANWLIRLRLI